MEAFLTVSPYAGLPPEKFWKTGVSEQHPLTINGLYRRKFEIGLTDPVATAGSCFAQHIARHLRARKFRVIDTEPAPPDLPDAIAQKFGYRLYSARYGNIYTARQLRQLLNEAFDGYKPANAIWERDGMYFDAMRPSVEPDGLSSPEQVVAHRARHLERVREVMSCASVLVFTFGLTEAWTDRRTGTVYPTAPGTIAGVFDSEIYEFKNFAYDEIYDDFIAARDLIKKQNPGVKFLLTVSPVPLTATATTNHVLVATTYSKSVLRAAAGRLCELYDDVDYFPSYEIIASPFARGFFYEPNLRAVSQAGVDTVMRVFFSEHGISQSDKLQTLVEPSGRLLEATSNKNEDVVCEELLLDAFSR